MIEHCFMNEGTDFTREYKVGDLTFIVRNLTSEDLDIIEEHTTRIIFNNGLPVPIKKNRFSEQDLTICLALGGEYKGVSYKLRNEGWYKETDPNYAKNTPVTYNAVKMMKPEIKIKLSSLISEMLDNWYKNKEDIEKN